MSHSSETAVAPDRRESPSLASVRREVERLAGSDEAKVLGPFTDVLLAKAPADLLQERGPEALARTVLDVFRFLERASPDRVNVEVVATNTATAVHTLVSDRPFVIDTVRECVAAHDLAIEYIVYPVPHVRRDEQGRVVEVRRAERGEPRHSLVHCEVARVADPGEALRADLERRLHDVVRATDDFRAMQEAVDRVIAELEEHAPGPPARRAELTEIQVFLRWLRDDAFVFLDTEPTTCAPSRCCARSRSSQGRGSGSCAWRRHRRTPRRSPSTSSIPRFASVRRAGPC